MRSRRVLRRFVSFLRGHKKVFGIGGSILLLALWAGQLAYPSGRMLPRTYISKQPIGFNSAEQVKDLLMSRAEYIELDFNGAHVKISPAGAGVELNVGATISKLPTPKSTDRFIPFWPLIKAVKGTVIQPVIVRSPEQVSRFAKTLANDRRRQPVDASAQIKDGQLTIAEAKEGEEYSAATIEKKLMSGDPFLGPTIKLEPILKPAAVYARDLEPLKKAFAVMTSQPLQISYGETVQTIDTKTLAGWLTVIKDPNTGKSRIELDPKALEAAAQPWLKSYTIAPGITQVSLVDNVEVSRRNGAAGRTIDIEAVKAQLSEWFKHPDNQTVKLTTKVLPPKVVATRTYSQTSAGLQAKLNYWISTHSGRYQVAIRELGGQGRAASYNVAQQTVMASTYKPFLAFVAYRQAESGALDLGTSLSCGKNIEQAIEVMIVNSDNSCAVALGWYIGWAKADEIIAASGFSGVLLNNYDSAGRLKGDKLVNAESQANFLAQLSGGVLINSSNTSKLLSYMKRQIYRQGIPVGSHGSVVADKVGFLEDYIHDVGIVYAPKATYALVIMSEGSSWSSISDLASAVYDFMNE